MVLVLRPGALGDTLLAVPALRVLRRRYGTVSLAAHGGAARLLEQLDEVDRGLPFDDPSLAWVFGATRALSDEPTVAWLSGERPPALRNALVVTGGRPTLEQHAALYLLETLEPLGIGTLLDDSALSVDPLHTDEVLIHPGSGSAAKNWPPDRFAAVIQALDRPVRLIVGEADERAAEAVVEAVGRELPTLEQPALDALAQRLAGCHAYLGNDSGVSHLAGLCGARSVVLFGPTSPVVWRPLGPHVQVELFSADARRLAAMVNRQ